MTDNPQLLRPTPMDDAQDIPVALDSPRRVMAEPMAAAPEEPQEQAKKKRGAMRIALMLSVPLAILLAGGYFYLTSGRFVTTDNAYVAQDKVSVTSEIGGPIVKVAVQENQWVKKGDLLFQIDPAPFELALQQANADIAAAQVGVATLQSDYSASTVDITAAREDIAFAEATYQRQKALLDRGFTTKASFDAASHAVALAKAQLSQAQADVSAARAKLATGSAVPGQNPQIAAAMVRRDQALLNLQRTQVHAPSDGRVTQSDRLQVGQFMVSGLPAITLVADQTSWVEANFKETQLAKMQVGQPVEVEFDAYPDIKLHGHVSSIGAGTGAEFSVLPAQNATGNWVKVTQRVPVRIAIDDKSPRQMIAGMSADVSVDVRDKQK